MKGSEIVVAVLLAIGVLGFAFTALGLIFSRDVYDQIHYLAPGSLLGAFAFVAAVIVHDGMSQSGAKAIIIGAVLVVSNPILSHATARAARVRRLQQVLPKPGEKVQQVEEEQ